MAYGIFVAATFSSIVADMGLYRLLLRKGSGKKFGKRTGENFMIAPWKWDLSA
jgi:hypothetical protein